MGTNTQKIYTKIKVINSKNKKLKITHNIFKKTQQTINIHKHQNFTKITQNFELIPAIHSSIIIY